MLSVLVQTACVDLSAIRKFTDISADAGKHFPALANDYYRSCMQQYYYQALEDDPFNVANLEEFSRALHNPDDPEITHRDPISAIEACRPFEADQKNLIKANKVLVAYLQTMGELAADDLTSYDKSLDGLNKSFVSSQFLQKDASDAVVKLAGVIIHAVTDGYRRKKLEGIIGEYNGDVRALAFGLQGAVHSYLTQLRNERGAMRDYYRTSIARYGDFASFQVRPRVVNGKPVPTVARNPLPIMAAKARWDAEESAIQTKIDAANAYRELLNNIADGHQALYRDRHRLNSQDVIQTALGYAKTADDLVEAFKKGF